MPWSITGRNNIVKFGAKFDLDGLRQVGIFSGAFIETEELKEWRTRKKRNIILPLIPDMSEQFI